MTTNNPAVLRRLFDEVWNAGDCSGLEEILAPAYEIRHDPGDPWHGKTLDRAGFAERARVSRAPFPDQRFEIVEALADGDRVAVSWTWVGTHLGDLPGFPASGKTIRMSGLTIYFFADGKVCGHWQVVDRLAVMQQLAAAKG